MRDTLVEITRGALGSCNSNEDRKKVYSKLYYFCKKCHNLSIDDFYSKIDDNTVSPYTPGAKGDYSGGKVGRNLYNVLCDGMSDVLNSSKNVNLEEKREVLQREFDLIQKFL